MSDTAGNIAPGPMENKGNLVYKFVSAEANVPIMMQNLADPIPKVIMMLWCYIKGISLSNLKVKLNLIHLVENKAISTY